MNSIPQWTRDPRPGSAEYELPLPRRLPAEPAAVRAAHAKVLAALSAEPDESVLRVDVTDGTLRLRYRTDVLDREAAARIAGYHLAALAVPDRPSLLSEAELRRQLEELAGPARELPGHRAHELFEERAALHPDAVAVVSADGQHTYGELNSRANRVARALLAHGLRAEGVVAVLMERNLDWPAAVLGLLKAGGVCLPIEPQLPVGPMRTMLNRADYSLILSKDSLATAYAGDYADTDLGLPVAADRLAHIRFTSGSPGEQATGVMYEHAGLLNHLLAKIDDLGIGPGDVVAQTAAQRSGAALWQLLSALLVGGRTLLVGQEAIRDVPRFADTIERAGVTVLEVEPWCLAPLLDELERRPRELPALRRVSVTGGAVPQEQARRWFAALPGVPLVNTYGVDGTSGDIQHGVLHGVPSGPRAPLGRPIANVRMYVVDERLVPVPLGAPGEIVVSGVCVGRGYVGDPERSRTAFAEDPYRPGERLYRSGDLGRRLPDGGLEILGRRDGRAEFRGSRVDIGEIESALLRVPGVRDAAVVVVRDTRPVAFCAGPEPVEPAAVRSELAASLPPHMVPPVVHWRERLPVTADGGTDRRTLTARAANLDAPGVPGGSRPWSSRTSPGVP
ncbi:non-ribosomal peptide synthetase [Streptomyces sp. Act143]|uniref:amino acid adenylation domain-containing protein n=1 Tax=Streptomyces sp. Act143 TaxID=2200760 RepID=UPI000D675CDB|nr:amino acid adenylation domain-containing protein [Streptomyces sp. Act143]PWI14637.1 non-ribosomal peptide synthetase [Streptomyces sp. Act143]